MIYAIVMAGGRGTRLKVDVEKPLFKLHGKPLIKYVLAVSYTHLTLPTTPYV